ncbi:MAG: replication restart helicase PriA [Fervidobacterium sp.]|uniref:replication restart helicase PriA n=1 Tax=Fervidobacterium sp. TaxID=1871331 RepID=UPI004049A05F
MVYAVAISELSENKLFLYTSQENIDLGERVTVNFRKKKTAGYVVAKSESVRQLLEDDLISSFLEDQEILSSGQLDKILERTDFVSFIDQARIYGYLNASKNYQYPIGRLFDISFPPSFDKYFTLYVESASPLFKFEKMKFEEFKKISKHKEYIANGLVRVYRDFESKVPRPRKDKDEYIFLSLSPSEIVKFKLTSKQSAVVNYLLIRRSAPIDEILKDLEDAKIDRNVIVQLKNKGILKISEGLETSETSEEFGTQKRLTDEQSEILRKIVDSFENQKHLLFGPTGSGKTEVYLEVMRTALNLGSVLYLVPEISLTEQTIARIKEKFPEIRLAVYHSYQTDSKKVEIWAKAVKGEIDVLVGPRSALFVPLKNPKLIIVDEEHDDGYYNNSEPYYDIHKILQYMPVKVIYGSATPHLETYKYAKEGTYNFHVLSKRFNVELPDVEIVDLRKEKMATPSISAKLRDEILETINNDKISLIFTRRKGFSRVQCAVCGYFVKCDNCDVALTYHVDKEKLKCHICGSEKELSNTCPVCSSSMFVDKGTGTEKVERELRTLFPGKSIGRIDAEIIDTPAKMKEVLEALREGKFDLVTGTKMITKGLDIYRIGLIGIVDIDALINYPDVNAPLRTFQTLVQVIGRAGRKEKGKALIQTYNPENPVIVYASAQDVAGYYERELLLRKELNYPPFADVVHVMYANQSAEIASETIDAVAEEIYKTDEFIDILGPSEHPIFKVQNKFRYQLFVKTHNPEKIVRIISQEKAKYPGDWIVRVNPPEI